MDTKVCQNVYISDYPIITMSETAVEPNEFMHEEGSLIYEYPVQYFRGIVNHVLEWHSDPTKAFVNLINKKAESFRQDNPFKGLNGWTKGISGFREARIGVRVDLGDYSIEDLEKSLMGKPAEYREVIRREFDMVGDPIDSFAEGTLSYKNGLWGLIGKTESLEVVPSSYILKL